MLTGRADVSATDPRSRVESSTVVRRVDAPPGPVEPGRHAGLPTTPVRELTEVLGHRRIGSYHALQLVSPTIAERAQPGQFLSLGVEAAGIVLRRPFALYTVSQQRPWAGTVEVIFDVVGPGTRWLADRDKHDLVDVVGPLGRPFPLPQQRVPCLLVGGGYGTAPLLYLAQILSQRRLRVDMVIGASTQARVFNAIEAKRLSAMTLFTTDDGSFGQPGRVTDVLDDALESSGARVVYACGPMPMLAGVASVCARRGVPCQVSVEQEMACGTGVCWTCVVPYWRKGRVQHLRSCIDGPVMNASRVAWDVMGLTASPPGTGPAEAADDDGEVGA